MATTRAMEHRGAIAVNNLGVSLLEAGRIDHAVASLQDALKLLKMGSDSATSQSSSRAFNSSLDETMKRAAERFSYLANPAKQMIANVTLITVSDSVDAAEIGKTLKIPHPGNATSLFAVRIEPEPTGFCYESEESILLSCILVLHNLGLAMLLQSRSRTGKDVTVHHGKSLRMFQLCEKVLQSLGTSTRDDHHLQMKLLAIRGILSVSVIESMRASGRVDGVDFQLHRDFQTTLANIRWPDCFQQPKKNAAAA